MATQGIRVHVIFKFVGDKSEMMAIMDTLIKETRKENGCILYELFEQTNNPEGIHKIKFCLTPPSF